MIRKANKRVQSLRENTLAWFINLVCQKHKISQRQFAELVGVSSRTINSIVNEEAEPELATLKKLVKALRTFDEYHDLNIQTIIALAFPEVAADMGLDPALVLYAMRLRDLPEHIRHTIDAILASQESLGSRKKKAK